MREQNVPTKAVVTVSEMARMVGLSRSRFYQLMQAGVFPQPVYSVSNRRPVYIEELQQVCLEVRRRNCGVNGQPVLFYSRGHRLPTQTKPTRTTKAKPATPNHADLLNGLAALGLTTTAAQVESAVKALYPAGVKDTDQGEVLRAVFLHLKRQNSADKVGR
jgi:hypothetical protein